MHPYFIQYSSTYPSYGSSQRPIVASDNLVKSKPDCSKEGEKDMKQDNKYLQPRWCPSGLSHTQKRRQQRMRKKESMEQQVEVVPARSATMKQVWRPKQVVSSSAWKRSKIWPIDFITLRTKYGRCIFIIVLRQFWSRGLFFGMLASPKKTEGICWRPKLALVEQTGLTGAFERSDRSGPCSRSGNTDRSDRSDRSTWNPSTTRTLCRFRYVIEFLAG